MSEPSEVELRCDLCGYPKRFRLEPKWDQNTMSMIWFLDEYDMLKWYWTPCGKLICPYCEESK